MARRRSRHNTVTLNISMPSARANEFFTPARKRAIKKHTRRAGRATKKGLRWTGRQTGKGLSSLGRRLEKL